MVEMIDANDLREGTVIELDGELYSVVDFVHTKPGKGGAFIKTKLKPIKEGGIIERIFRSDEKLRCARIESKPLQFLYRSGTDYYFMDTNTFEEIPFSEEFLGKAIYYLKENMEVELLTYENLPVCIQLPYFVELSVIKTEPGIKGDTVSGGTKPATLETGFVLQVPLFIEVGDVIRIDTRTNKYLERVE